MSEHLDRWRARAWEDEAPILMGLVREALSSAPSPEGLRGLALGAPATRREGQSLSAGEQQRALEHVRWGVAAEDAAVRWDAIHAAGELAAPDVAEPLARVAAGVFADAKRHPEGLRARAVEVYAALAAKDLALERLESLRTEDPSWTVRRLAADAIRSIHKQDHELGHLFSRLRAQIRCELMRVEADEEPLELEEVVQLGLRLPAALRLFYAELLPGGRLIHVEEAGKGAEAKDGEFLFLTPPTRLPDPPQRPSDLENFNQYVWTRYVDGSRKYPKVDEDYALARYAEHYDRARIDAEAWGYGVLLFEAAFRDEARRAEHLLRCRDVLEAYKELSPEEWDVVDDRLEEVEETVRGEGLTWPEDVTTRAIPVGSYMGVVELSLDAAAPGVFAKDPEAGPARWRVAPSVAAFLGAPLVRRAGDLMDQDPMELLAQVAGHMDRGERKQAGRLFADVLERFRAPKVLEAAAELFERDDMDPLTSAQLLSTVLLEGDRKSADVARSMLQALPPERAQAMVEAAGPHDEDGSQLGLFVDAAAGLRKRTHTGAKDAAKQLKEIRGNTHIRTLRNPWYKS